MKSCIAILLLAPALARSQAAPTWRLVEEWRKGGAVEGPYAFDVMFRMRYSSLASAPGGRIVMLDSEGSRLHIYDSTGAVIRSIGRAGSGPGEFRSPMGVAIKHDGRIVLSDQRNGRLVVFSAAGDFERVVTMTRRAPFAFDIAWDGSFDTSGRLLQSLPLPPKQPRPAGSGPAMAGDSALMTERLASDLANSDTVTLCHSPVPAMQDPARYFTRVRTSSAINLENRAATAPPAPIAATWPIPFTEQRSTFVRDREGFAWSSRSNAIGELVRTDGRNCSSPVARATLRGGRATIPPAVREKEVTKAQPDMRPVIPTIYPWFRALRIDDQNRLWVERDVAGGKRFDVFAPNGRPVAEVDAPATLAPDLPVVIAHNRVFGFVKDADDVAFLVSWRVVTK